MSGLRGTPALLGRLALADFLDRARRPVYAVTLAAAVALGYLAVPEPDSRWVVLQIGDYRGVYNSAYTGMATAFAGGLWLTLGGFYVVRSALSRDESTGVGRLLAATPLRTRAYFAAKLLSNILVLASMVGVLAVTAFVMQFARDEVRTLEPVALLAPFALIALPMVVLTAAAALLFEAVPALRAGLGNVIWFFVWLVVAIGGQSSDAPLDGIGVHSVVTSMLDDLEAQGHRVTGEFSLGLTVIDEPLHTFEWGGFTPGGGYLLTRVLLTALAVGIALLPALWFDRFDPARRGGVMPAAPAGAGGFGGAANAAEPFAPTTVLAPVGPPRTEVRPGRSTLRRVAGELRVLTQGTPWWWWSGVAACVVVPFFVPLSAATRFVLPVAWILPVLVWSRLGSQRHEDGVESLMAAYPAQRRGLAAEWIAGFAVTALTGAGPLARMLVAGDGRGAAHWVCGALFISSLALGLGTVSRSHRLFQAVYLPLWYATATGLPLLDFMGAVRSGGVPAGPHPAVFAALAAALLGAAFAARALRERPRG